jgi:hypothetical protein
MIEPGQLRCWTIRRPPGRASEGAGIHFIVLEKAIGESMPLGDVGWWCLEAGVREWHTVTAIEMFSYPVDQ